MTEGLSVAQPDEAAAFSVLVMRAKGRYEYEIKDKADDVCMPEVAEALFAIALDIHAEEGIKNR